MKKRTVTAAELKANCTSLLDDIEHDGLSVTVTRRGRPVAVIGPPDKKGWKSPRDSWAGKMRIVGDIVNSDTADLWSMVRDK